MDFKVTDFKVPAATEAEKLFRLSATFRPLTEHARMQEETISNLARLRAERLARETVGAQHA